MLGSMVFDILSKNPAFDVRGTARNPKEVPSSWQEKTCAFDAEKDDIAETVFNDFRPEYIVNCIGILKPYCKDNDQAGVLRAIRVNALFPHLLASAAEDIEARVIQIATDCVYSGTLGSYMEQSPHDPLDVYGKTKSLGEVKLPRFLNIRTSIIGPEPKAKVSLLEWFLSQTKEDKVTGFTHHLWNGVTTLQFANVCEELIEKGDENFDALVAVSNIHHLVINETVNKFELLAIFNKVFDKGLEINAVDNIGQPVDRSLGTEYASFGTAAPGKMEDALLELKRYMESGSDI
ncbi:MAG: dTDP-4-dehydrorhamnose reductase [Parcubacteria group bacterium]|nr:dTDP-4-dehydrorhamnose reductase [Parcubacteria group bacterium]